MSIVGSMDMGNRRDRATVRRTVTDELHRMPRWNITPEFRTQIMVALQAAHTAAVMANDVGAINDITATVAKLDMMNLSDEQHADKMRRADMGIPTGDITVITIPPPVRAKLE